MVLSSSSHLPRPPSSPSLYGASKSKLRELTASGILLAVREKSCPICLRNVDAGRAAVITPCFHAYCHGCLLRWSSYKRSCPLCNAGYDSYFCSTNLSSGTFQKLRLPPPSSSSFSPSPSGSFPVRNSSGESARSIRLHNPLVVERIIRRAREKRNCASSRSRPLPHRRSFGVGVNSTSDAIAERVLQWRASIYKQHLQAVPLKCGNYHQLSKGLTNVEKERILQRIEPWIRRELHAILNDPDPTVIVHVATSLFISNIERKSRIPSSQVDFLAPLRRFLYERTDMFWHELRCFAESSFTMDTYDVVVEYKSLDESICRSILG